MKQSKMIEKSLKINGNRFSNLNEFYNEIEKQLTKNLDWKIGRNLDAFNDILCGGFGVYEYEEPIEIIWTNSMKSKMDFGFDATIEYLLNKLETCHPTNKKDVKADIKLAKKNQGQTLFDIMIEIINCHEHIKLKLD